MTSDRRTFLGAGLGIAAAATSRRLGPHEPTQPKCRRARQHSRRSTLAISGTWGAARGGARPASSADIASLMRWAGSIGLKVAARRRAARSMAVP